MVDNLYNNYTFTETHIALVLDLSAHVATDAGDGDLGDVMEPLDVVDEGEELEVGDRIERSRV